MDVTIRRVRADEASVLKEIRLAALAEAPFAFGSTYAEEVQFPDEHWMMRAERGSRGDDSVTFFAVVGDRILGLAGGYRPEPFDGAFELVSMWVRPEARGAGIAQRLVDAVVDWAAGAGATAVELCVTEGNPAGGQRSTSALASGPPAPVSRYRRTRRRSRSACAARWWRCSRSGDCLDDVHRRKDPAQPASFKAFGHLDVGPRRHRSAGSRSEVADLLRQAVDGATGD